VAALFRVFEVAASARLSVAGILNPEEVTRQPVTSSGPKINCG